MAVSSQSYTEETRALGGAQLHLLRGGSGRPALVLHGIEGPEGWLAFHEGLAVSSTVLAPDHPGFGQSSRPDWLESITHQALFYQWFLQDAGLDEYDVIGCGIGGWIAAEMATMCTHGLRHLVLVGAAGLRPREGSAPDIFVRPWREVIDSAFHASAECAEFERVYSARPIVDFGGEREAGRSMTMRMCYRPYMHNPALAGLLPRIQVPTLVIWGADDRLIPVDCGQHYAELIPGARLQVIERCGHMAHWERPHELVDMVSEFLR